MRRNKTKDSELETAYAMGFTMIPNVLLLNMGTLGLTSQDLWVITMILAHKWNNTDKPYFSIKRIAKFASISYDTARQRINNLVKKGYLRTREATDKKPTDTYWRWVNYYDLSPLWIKLQGLSCEQTNNEEIEYMKAEIQLVRDNFHTHVPKNNTDK